MNKHVVIIGLGYVGLPLAQAAVHAGIKVTGLDTNPRVSEALNRGDSHVDDLTKDDVISMLKSGFSATADSSVLEDADIAIVCVPTPLSPEGGPDLTAVNSAIEMISDHIHPGMLVILESTTYPGTTDEVVRPTLERSGLKAGVDFNLAFSPERIDPGNAHFGTKNTPKVVGGHTPKCGEVTAAFYKHFVNVTVQTRGTREAEMAKLLENTYRHVNIALVNEMAKFCHDLGIDLWDVINAASSKPFGFQAFYPGPGVGGHCIPIDPNYLSHNVQAKLGYPFRFVELAQEINSQMPAYVVDRAGDLLNEYRKPINGSRILLLGITYKPDIADQRESPATAIAQLLIDKGAEVRFHDPLVENWSAMNDLRRVTDLEQALSSSDLTILLQNHRSFDLAAIAQQATLVLDTRGVSHPTARVRLL